MSTTATQGLQQAAQRAFGQAATHMHRPGFAGPLCGQVSATGKGWARTHYTSQAAQVTRKKCLRTLALQEPAR